MAVLVTSTSKAVRISPRKIGLVAGLVRGRSVDDALVILENTPKRAATPLLKTIASAKANAEHNHNLKSDGLVIEQLQVGPGPRFKRFRPVARGSAHSYMHRTSHIKVVISGNERPKPKTAKPATTKKEEK
jgi:large subunit ribosomal protein L22